MFIDAPDPASVRQALDLLTDAVEHLKTARQVAEQYPGDHAQLSVPLHLAGDCLFDVPFVLTKGAMYRCGLADGLISALLALLADHPETSSAVRLGMLTRATTVANNIKHDALAFVNEHGVLT